MVSKKEVIAEQVDIIKKSIKIIKRICKYPPAKRSSTEFKRAIRITQHLVIIKVTYMHIQMIIAQPEFPSGELSVIGEGIELGVPEQIMPLNKIKELTKSAIIKKYGN